MREWTLYLLFLLAFLLSLYAQLKVSLTFHHYQKRPTRAARPACEVARMILDRNGLQDVAIRRVSGHLTDHYDPAARVLALSDSTCDSCSAAAIGVAAHEAGHAIQHAEGYLPIRIRSALVPLASFGSRAAWLFIMLGVLISALAGVSEGVGLGGWILTIGIGLFGLTTLFQLVTLPCEWNASRRAMRQMQACGWYDRGELVAARRVLSAAALTYLASLLVSFVQLLRLIALLGRRGGRR